VTRSAQLAHAFWRPRPAVPGMRILDPSRTRMRVLLADLDLYRHVNNGIYLRYMDVARVNYLADMGALGKLSARSWYPVVAATTMKYRRPLTWLQQFSITTRVVGWDERIVYMDQVVERDGEHVARCWAALRFLARPCERVAASAVIELLGDGESAPTLPSNVAAWASAIDVAAR